jgi:hypothetical protein
MNDKDEEAFDKWYGSENNIICKGFHYEHREAWQAACEYKEGEVKAYVNHLKDFDDEIGRLQAENKKLREALEFYSMRKNDDSSNHWNNSKAIEALKEVGKE